jgi:hypothetical protein
MIVLTVIYYLLMQFIIGSAKLQPNGPWILTLGHY